LENSMTTSDGDLPTQYRVHDRVKARIRSHGMSVAEVARRAGFNYYHVESVLNGRRLPTLQIMTRLARVLSVAPEALFPEEYPSPTVVDANR